MEPNNPHKHSGFFLITSAYPVSQHGNRYWICKTLDIQVSLGSPFLLDTSVLFLWSWRPKLIPVEFVKVIWGGPTSLKANVCHVSEIPSKHYSNYIHIHIQRYHKIPEHHLPLHCLPHKQSIFSADLKFWTLETSSKANLTLLNYIGTSWFIHWIRQWGPLRSLASP